MRSKIFYISLLHFFNDGFSASLFLFLPFIAKDLHLNLAQVGAMGAGLNLLSAVVALPSASLADKFGHFKILLWSALIYGLGYIAIAGAGGFVSALSLFIFVGIGFGLFHPLGFSLISRLSDDTNIGRNMGDFTAWGDIGRITISSAVTFLIVAINWRKAALLYGFLSLFILGYLYLFHFKKYALAHYTDRQNQKGKLNQLLGNRKFIFAALVASLDNLASSGLFVFLPFLLLSKNIQPTFLGTFAAAFVVGNLLGKALLGRVVDKVGSAKIFILTEILMALLIGLLIFAHALWLVVAVSILLGVATRGTVPATQTMVYESMAETRNFEQANAVTQFGDTIAAVIVPLILGFVSNHFGINTAFGVAAGFALLAILPALAFISIPKKAGLIPSIYRIGTR